MPKTTFCKPLQILAGPPNAAPNLANLRGRMQLRQTGPGPLAEAFPEALQINLGNLAECKTRRL
eukprot:8077773-Lingulodinium_polyedra.AAC.1